MTLNSQSSHRFLEEYFHQIVKQQPLKETTMFERTKMFFTQQIEKINSLLTKPVAFVDETQDPKLSAEEGYWSFEMYTPEWIDTELGSKVEALHTLKYEHNDDTWMEVLDNILDEMEKHYGYNIKEQVYYSVSFPTNTLEYSVDGTPPAGYGRMLNDELFQQILLAFPELYESGNWADLDKQVMFK